MWLVIFPKISSWRIDSLSKVTYLKQYVSLCKKKRQEKREKKGKKKTKTTADAVAKHRRGHDNNENFFYWKFGSDIPSEMWVKASKVVLWVDCDLEEKSKDQLECVCYSIFCKQRFVVFMLESTARETYHSTVICIGLFFRVRYSFRIPIVLQAMEKMWVKKRPFRFKGNIDKQDISGREVQ